MRDLKVDDAGVPSMAGRRGSWDGRRMTGRLCGGTRRKAVRRLGALLAITGVAAVAACSTGSPPPAPEVAWEGEAPQGPLESDPWVSAVRAGLVAFGVAANSADFSDPSLTSTWSRTQISRFVTSAQGDLLHGTAKVYLGPLPFVPLAVEVADDGASARVVVCIDQYETLPARHPDSSRWPMPSSFVVELSEEGDRLIAGTEQLPEPFLLLDGSELTPEHCDRVPIPRARFEPPPDLSVLADKGRDDVKQPPPSPSPTFAVEVPER